MNNKNKLLLLSLLFVLYSMSYTEDLEGTVFFETNYLKLKEKGSKKVEKLEKEKYWVNIWRNKQEIKNTKYYEENTLLNVDSNSIGLLATGDNVKIINNNEILLNNGGIGMNIINNALMENNTTGKITLKGNNEVGMLSSALTTGINKGIINLSSGNDYTQSGMASENGGTSINDGEIIINSDSSYGMLANSDPTSKISHQTTLLNNNNIILNKSFAGIGMESRDDLSIGTNQENITIKDSTNVRGMVSAKGAESINEGIISLINSKQSFGMNIGDGDSITGKKTIIRNNQEINIDSNSTNSIGMRVYKETGYEMDNGLGQNFGTINILGKDNIGMYASGANTEIINNKTISLLGKHNIGIQSNLNGSSGINNGEIIINNNSVDSFGMVTFTGGSIVNNGDITINSGANTMNVGMQSVDGIALNNSNINLMNKNQVGMNAAGNGIGENKGVINISNTEGSSFGMTAKQGATIINTNKINLVGTGSAMSNELLADKNVTLLNKGDILIKTNYSSAMAVNQNSNITNEGKISIVGEGNTGIIANNGSIVKTIKGSSITLTGNSNIGISLNDAKLENNGNIKIDGQNNTGIKTQGASKVINTGTIDIVSGEQNKGIVISKNSILQNTGTIIIKNEDVTSKPSAKRPDKNLGIYNMGTIINSGKLAVSGEFNSANLGSGSLVMDKNSNLEADKINGNIYLSGGITTGSIKDEYSTYKMFNTNEMEANLLSNSLLFDTKLVNNENNYFDAVLTRKNFNEVVNDNSLANYLEKNYIDTNNKEKISLYDRFKLVSNNQQMDTLVDDTFGRTVFPTLQKQTFEMIRLNDNILKNNVSKDSMKEEFKYIVGGAYNRIDSDSSKNTQGYISSLRNIWIGAEKKVNNSVKTGFILSIGEYNSNFTKNSHREDEIFQGTFFINYNKDNINMRSFTTFGGLKTDLDRKLSSFNETLSSEFNSRYFIFSNEASKKFNFENDIYVSPKISLNLYRMKQDNIKEENGQYAIDIDKVKGFIIEPGVGIALGKNTTLNNEYKLNTELEFNYFYKDGDLENNLDGKIKSISNDIFVLKGYDFTRNSGNGKLKITLEKENWNVYTSYQLIFEEKISNITTLGINYKFN